MPPPSTPLLIGVNQQVLDPYTHFGKWQALNSASTCNQSFYEAVVRPAISDMSAGFTQQIHGRSVKCTSVRKTQDKSSNIPGLFLRFEVSGQDMCPNPAPLSVHLHNTQRKIQLQGGATMPNKTKLPVWFVENVLSETSLLKRRGVKVIRLKISTI